MASSVFNTCAVGEAQNTGPDQILASGVIGLSDMVFQDRANSIFTPRPATAVRNYAFEFRDIEPDCASGDIVKFGQKVSFRCGQGGLALLHKLELCIEIEQPGNYFDGDPTNGFAGHDDEGMLEWVPWLGERLIGDQVLVKYQNNNTRCYSQTYQHYLYRLKEDVSTQKDEAYKGGVLSDGANFSTKRIMMVVPIMTAFGSDYTNSLVTAAMPNDLIVSFRVPPLSSLLRARGVAVQACDESYSSLLHGVGGRTAATIASLSELPILRMSMREHYISLHKAERAFRVETVNRMNGISHNFLDNEEICDAKLSDPHKDEDKSLALREQRVDLTPFRNPATIIFAIVRLQVDLEDATLGDYNAITVDNLRDVLEEKESGGLYNPRPQYFGNIPIVKWSLNENKQRFTMTYSQQYWDRVESSRFFNHKRNLRIATVPLSLMPLVEPHSTGHKTMSNLNSPAMVFSVCKYFNMTDKPQGVSNLVEGVATLSPCDGQENGFKFDWLLNNWGQASTLAGGATETIAKRIHDGVAGGGGLGGASNSTLDTALINGKTPRQLWNELMAKRVDVFAVTRNISHQEWGHHASWWSNC
jgi:hypothetical protein